MNDHASIFPPLLGLVLAGTGGLVAWRLRRVWLQKESAHRQMFEANPLPMWVYDLESLRFLAVNDAAIQHYGYTRDEFLAMTIKDIRPPEDIPALLDNISHVTQGLDQAGYWRHFKKDGSIIDVEITSHTLTFAGRRAEAVLAYDVTERNRNRAALVAALDEAKRARARIVALVASVTDGLLGIDIAGRIVIANHAAETLLGADLREGEQLPVGEMFQGPLSGYLGEVLANPDKERAATVEVPAGKNLPPRIIQLRTTRVRTAEGTVAGSITNLRDISQEREIDRLKSEFVATAAHELLTPIATVMGYSELLLRREAQIDLTSEQVQNFLGEIFAKAEILERIVDDLLFLGRMEAGRPLILDRRPYGINGLVEEVVHLQRIENPSRRFIVEQANKLPPLLIDQKRIRQVLDNLINNAVRFSRPDGPVKIATGLSGDVVRIAVTDHGIGMTPEQVSLAFDKFYRGNTGNTAVGGLGLGLSISKSIVEAHGGRIWLESSPGIGTTAAFTLPPDA